MELKNYIVPSTDSYLTEGHIRAKDLIEKINLHDGNEAYHSLFDMEPRENYKAYEGLHYPASGWVVIDIDYDFPLKNDIGETIYYPQTGKDKPKHKPDVFKNAEAAKATVIKIISDLNLDESWVRVFFSGSKGFHLYIRAEYFGINEPSSDVSTKLKKIIFALSKKFSFPFDTKVYHAARKFRLPSSRNPKSGLFKTQISFDELKKITPQEIIKRAEKPSFFDLENYKIPKAVYEIASEILSVPVQMSTNVGGKTAAINGSGVFGGEILDESFSNTIKNKPCIERMVEGKAVPGERHDAAMSIIIDSFDIGLSEGEALTRIAQFCKNSSLEDRLKQYSKDVELKYQGNFPYKSGCYMGIKHKLCSGKCPLYKKLDPTQRAIVSDPPKETAAEIVKNEIVKKVKEGNYPKFVHVHETKNSYTVLDTYQNFLALAEFIGIKAKYNIIKKKSEVIIPETGFHPDNEDNNKLHSVVCIMNQYRMPSTKADEHINMMADQYQYNPVAEWILSEPWDGISRFGDLLATVESPKEHEEIKRATFKRWLVSCVAAMFEERGFTASGVLVFVGAQYAGKTNWIKRFAPPEFEVIKTGLSIDTENKDSVAKAVTAWICELGELDATFRKSDISRLKAFITESTDEFRAPYARKSSKFQRRTVFYASVNNEEFLNDPTGNRRFWPIRTDKVHHDHNINMQQLWAEVYQWYKSGEKWWLSDEEFKGVTEHNENFTTEEPWVIRLQEMSDWNDSDNITAKPFVNKLTSTEIAMLLGVKHPTKADVTRIGIAAAKLGWPIERTRNNRCWVFKSKADCRIRYTFTSDIN